MKALSIQQPWAWLIVNGYKDVENRSWPTNVRGRIAIHAGKKFDSEGYEWVLDNRPDIEMPHPAAFEFGGIVGSAVLTDCITEPLNDEALWFFGPYGFVFADPSSQQDFVKRRAMMAIRRMGELCYTEEAKDILRYIRQLRRERGREQADR